MKNTKKILLAAVFSALAGSAIAGDLYMAGSLGRATANLSKGDLDDIMRGAGATGLSSSLDKTDTAYKLQLGYQFNQNFAIEGGYVDMGDIRYNASFTGGNGTVKWKVDGWNLNAVGTLPLGANFSLLGKVGVINAKVKASLNSNLGSDSATSTGWYNTYGLGARYDFTRNVAAVLEYEAISNIGKNNSTGKSDVDIWTVGLRYQF